MKASLKPSRIAKFMWVKFIRHPSSRSYRLKKRLKSACALIILGALITLKVSLWPGLVCLGIGLALAIHAAKLRKLEHTELSSTGYQVRVRAYLDGSSNEMPEPEQLP
jgi:hypothetical protein